MGWMVIVRSTDWVVRTRLKQIASYLIMTKNIINTEFKSENRQAAKQ